ncbi:hypothetical protein QAD02_015960 [Eretmocerus hayati]|uniref:Uncharacterized protein n=1 Tax=Eretmocerus hayati TaxID=131215 RepID=A0ACC2PAN8_9HYME|nr:hypothetical protein QAD02_015960 [Eretmocerus hayati]
MTITLVVGARIDSREPLEAIPPHSGEVQFADDNSRCLDGLEMIFEEDCAIRCRKIGQNRNVGGICLSNVCFCDWHLRDGDYLSSFLSIRASRSVGELSVIMPDFDIFLCESLVDISAPGNLLEPHESDIKIANEHQSMDGESSTRSDGLRKALEQHQKASCKHRREVLGVMEVSDTLSNEINMNVEPQPGPSCSSDECPAVRPELKCRYENLIISEHECSTLCLQYGKHHDKYINGGVCKKGDCYCTYSRLGFSLMKTLEKLAKEKRQIKAAAYLLRARTEGENKSTCAGALSRPHSE